MAAIERANDREAIEQAITRFVVQRSESRGDFRLPWDACLPASSAIQAVGSLRVAGLYQVASEVESFLESSCTGDLDDLPRLTTKAFELVERVDSAIHANRKRNVQTRKPLLSNVALHRPLGLLLAAALMASAGATSAAADVAEMTVSLSPTQRETLLAEATEAYSQGIAKSQTDSADAKELLATAADKYQLLVDSGIHNAELFTNLGNAYLQTGKLGHAIANYQRARHLDPRNTQVLKNLAFANEKIASEPKAARSETGYLRAFNDRVVGAVGARPVMWTLALSSLAFWGLLILRVVHRPFPVWKCAAGPLVVLLITLGSVALTRSNPRSPWNAVIVADNVSLHAGDGDRFDEVVSVESSQGHRVELLSHRGNWSRIKTADGHIGWVHSDDVLLIREAIVR